MADRPHNSDTADDTGTGPDRRSTTGPPLWVKVSGVIGIVVALLLAFVLLNGGGQHGPARHAPDGDGARQTAPLTVSEDGGGGNG